MSNCRMQTVGTTLWSQWNVRLEWARSVLTAPFPLLDLPFWAPLPLRRFLSRSLFAPLHPIFGSLIAPLHFPLCSRHGSHALVLGLLVLNYFRVEIARGRTRGVSHPKVHCEELTSLVHKRPRQWEFVCFVRFTGRTCERI